MKSRLICLFTVFVFLLALLAGRLGFIQLLKGGEYRQQVKKQSLSLISEIPVRGTIYDREGRPLTNSEKVFFVLLNEKKMDRCLVDLLKELEADELESNSDKYRIYRVTKAGQGLSKLYNEYGAQILQYFQRDDIFQPAIHVIGGNNPKNHAGLWGIEKDYDHILSSEQRLFYAQNDGQGNLLPGSRINVQGDSHHWGVLTSLDQDIQTYAEEALKECRRGGTVIVTDIMKGEILAYAGFSGHTSKNYKEELQKVDFLGPLIKKGAELEKQINDAIDSKVKNTDIFDMASAFGMAEKAVANLSSQSSGNLSELRKDILGNGLSVIEERLMVTPMQVARMTTILARDGLDRKLSLVRGTLEGVRGASLVPRLEEKQVISLNTSRELKGLLKEIVDEGSNCYTGFVPFENPKYAITVSIVDEDEKSKCAARVFKNVCQMIR